LAKKNHLTANYLIHGILLTFISNNLHVFSAVNKLLEYFLCEKTLSTPSEGLSITFFDNHDDTIHQGVLPSGLKLLYSSSKEDLFDIKEFGIDKMSLYVNEDDFTYYVAFGTIGLFSYSMKKGVAEGYLKEPEAINPNLISSFVFIFLLAELLKGKGYFLAHCSGVEKRGQGIIFPGFSGAGKTTSCVALIRQGFGFLGDDRPILRYNKSGGLELLSFPEPIDVTDYTIQLFPELKNYRFFLDNRNLRKQSFIAEELYPGSTRDSCVPKLILFPEISAAKKSSLEVFPKSEALKTFLPHSLLAFDKETARQHFDIIFDLIQSTDCYKVKLGADIQSLPDLVDSVL
jgi:hypothetical protein